MNRNEWSKLYNLLQWDDDMDLVLGNADDEWFDAYTFEDFIKTMKQEALDARRDYIGAISTAKQFPGNSYYKKAVQEAAEEYNRFNRVIKALESVKDKFPDHSKQDEKERKVWDKLANYGINNKYQINEVAQELRKLIGSEWEDESDESDQVEAAASNMEQYVPLPFSEIFGNGSEAGPADHIPYLEAVQNLDHRCYEYFDSNSWNEDDREGEIWDEVINAIDTPEMWTILANAYKFREFFNSLEESLVEDIVKDELTNEEKVNNFFELIDAGMNENLREDNNSSNVDINNSEGYIYILTHKRWDKPYVGDNHESIKIGWTEHLDSRLMDYNSDTLGFDKDYRYYAIFPCDLKLGRKDLDKFVHKIIDEVSKVSERHGASALRISSQASGSREHYEMTAEEAFNIISRIQEFPGVDKYLGRGRKLDASGNEIVATSDNSSSKLSNSNELAVDLRNTLTDIFTYTKERIDSSIPCNLHSGISSNGNDKWGNVIPGIKLEITPENKNRRGKGDAIRVSIQLKDKNPNVVNKLKADIAKWNTKGYQNYSTSIEFGVFIPVKDWHKLSESELQNILEAQEALYLIYTDNNAIVVANPN